MKTSYLRTGRAPLVRALSTTFLAALLAAVLLPTLGHAQWIGAGAGGAGTDFNNTANWTGGTMNGSFVSNNATATIALSSATTTLSSMNFNWATNAINLNINGNGTGAAEVIQLNGNILLPSVTTTSSTITLGSDVTLDYGSFGANREIKFGSVVGTNATQNSLVINGLVTGSTTNDSSINLSFLTRGSPRVFLNNTGNTFDAAINSSGGHIFYNSIGNVGGGASSLGAPTTAIRGKIIVESGLIYNGTNNTSSDRILELKTSGAVINNSTNATTQTFTSLGTSGTINGNIRYSAMNSGSILDMQGVIQNSTSGIRTAWVNRDTQIAGVTGGGVGIVRFSNMTNTYNGMTLLNGGILEVTKLADGGVASSIGNSSNLADNLRFQGGALRYIGSGDSTDRLFNLNSANSVIYSSGTGALNFTNPGAIQLSVPTTTLVLRGLNTNDNTLSPVYSGSNNMLTKVDGGKWILGATNNTYGGATTVTGGTLEVTKLADGGVASSIGNSANSSGNLILGSGATLSYTGSGDSTDRLFRLDATSFATISSSGAGALNFTSAGSINVGTGTKGLILRGTNTGNNTLTPVYSGTSNTLTKMDAGKWILGGANTYGGATAVNGGALIIDGSTTGSALTVASTGVLGGTGTITPGAGKSLSVQSGGTMAPGASIGTLNVDLGSAGDSASFASGALFVFELGAPGTSDLLNFTGLTANSSDVTFNSNLVNFTNAGGLANGIYTLFSFDQNNAFTGTLAFGSGLESFAGSDFIYNASSIQLNVVPEPSTWALLAGGLTIVMVLLRRRQS